MNHIRGDLYFKVKLKRQWFSASSLHTWFEMVTCKVDVDNVTRFQRKERMPTRLYFRIHILNMMLTFGESLMLFRGRKNWVLSLKSCLLK